MFLASTGVEDGYPYTSMPNDPEPSPMQNVELIWWCAWQIDMLVWWCELQEVLGMELMWKVHALFKVPKAQSCMMGVDKDNSAPLAHWSLEKYKFMLPPDLWFSSRDYQLAQPQQTLAYVKVLQYWAEKAQLPIPSELCHLVESVFELRWAMELMVSFTDEEVLVAAEPSNWVAVTMPRPTEPTLADPHHSHSHSHNTLGHPRRCLMAAHSGDWPVATEKRDEPAIPPWEVMMQLPVPEHKSLCPLPRFVEIARSLQGEHHPWMVIGVHAGEEEESSKPISSSIMATWLFWHPTLGDMYIDMLTCMMLCKAVRD